MHVLNIILFLIIIIRYDDEKKELHIGDNNITLNHNLYVAAFGKAALGRREYRRRILINIILFLIRHVPSCG